jgi:hypothetical protein
MPSLSLACCCRFIGRHELAVARHAADIACGLSAILVSHESINFWRDGAFMRAAENALDDYMDASHQEQWRTVLSAEQNDDLIDQWMRLARHRSINA